jgi:hypothetical protein
MWWTFLNLDPHRSTLKYPEDDIEKMLEFLIDNIFVVVGGHVFQQSVAISLGTNCITL